MKQCDNGHFYDEARFDSCPYCQENAGIGKTMAAGSIGKTVAVMPGSGPMEADLGMNYAIVIDELTKILDSEGIDYVMSGSGIGFAKPWMGYVFIPNGLLALAGAIVLMVQTQNSKKTRGRREEGRSPGCYREICRSDF